ncbi:MAG: alpha-ketoacid dehydrogenase subunit beta [Sandaracinaceae bacterium]|nr:alpha-ketoacid dehydrogenase subunit beta [Sandaracinaceae bacterium]MDW8245826.1 transketolase C-terminal domain-containing protein [Sandaracinaceae bacterium]
MATMVQAIRMALHVGESQLGVTDIFGEDVGPPLGGVFTATQGLRTAWNSPLDERGIVGAAMGLAMAGQRPVCEIQFCDYAFNTIDLLKLAGNTYWASAGDWNLPLVLMTPVGAGIHGSIYHSHSFDAQATRIPGWKIVIPSQPRDAYGLMLSAIVDPNPVMVLIPKALMRVRASGPEELIPGEPEDPRLLSRMIDAPIGAREGWEPDWPKTAIEMVPIGVARKVRSGRDLSVITYGRMVPLAKRVAEKLAQEGIEIEIIDLRSLQPYDWAAIADSVRKTRRVLFLNEDTEVTNFGEHLLRRTVESLWRHLDAPPLLEAGKHVPGIGLADELEEASVPGLASIEAAVRRLLDAPARPGDIREPKESKGFSFTWIDFDPITGPLELERAAEMARAFRVR